MAGTHGNAKAVPRANARASTQKPALERLYLAFITLVPADKGRERWTNRSEQR